MDTDGSNGGQAGVLRFPGAGQLADWSEPMDIPALVGVHRLEG